MYKRIDVDSETIDGYSFVDKDEVEVYVTRPYETNSEKGLVDIGYEYNSLTIFKESIPKLIKALEAAFNHKEV